MCFKTELRTNHITLNKIPPLFKLSILNACGFNEVFLSVSESMCQWLYCNFNKTTLNSGILKHYYWLDGGSSSLINILYEHVFLIILVKLRVSTGFLSLLRQWAAHRQSHLKKFKLLFDFLNSVRTRHWNLLIFHIF